MKVIIAFLFLLIVSAFTGTDTLLQRFKVPVGFHRNNNPDNSFAYWLNHLPLKAEGTPVKNYRGEVARTDKYTAAVIDMSVGKQDLQQCADAVMRLRAEYLYQQKRYQDIAFNFTSGFRCDYLHYAKGFRFKNGRWVLTARENYAYPVFLKYMDLVFSYAGTLSLEKELIKVQDATELKTGDVFIHGGSPGHCFIVMDVVEDDEHQKRFLLAQSFMPAQDIQLLQLNGNPWFMMDRAFGMPYGNLINMAYLRRFKN